LVIQKLRKDTDFVNLIYFPVEEAWVKGKRGQDMQVKNNITTGALIFSITCACRTGFYANPYGDLKMMFSFPYHI